MLLCTSTWKAPPTKLGKKFAVDDVVHSLFKQVDVCVCVCHSCSILSREAVFRRNTWEDYHGLRWCTRWENNIPRRTFSSRVHRRRRFSHPSGSCHRVMLILYRRLNEFGFILWGSWACSCTETENWCDKESSQSGTGMFNLGYNYQAGAERACEVGFPGRKFITIRKAFNLIGKFCAGFQQVAFLLGGNFKVENFQMNCITHFLLPSYRQWFPFRYRFRK